MLHPQDTGCRSGRRYWEGVQTSLIIRHLRHCCSCGLGVGRSLLTILQLLVELLQLLTLCFQLLALLLQLWECVMQQIVQLGSG